MHALRHLDPLNPPNSVLWARQDRLANGLLEFRQGLGYQQYGQSVVRDREHLWADVTADGMAGTGTSVEFNTHYRSFA